jgi:DHA2 family multidrug resistance protein
MDHFKGRRPSGAFATSLAQTHWNNAARASLMQLLNQFDSTRSMDQLNNGLASGQTPQVFDNLVQGQSVMLGTDRFFLTFGAVMVLAAFSIWLVAKPKPGAAPPVGVH